MDSQFTTGEMLGMSLAFIAGLLLLGVGVAWCVCPVECKVLFHIKTYKKPVEIRKPIILGEVLVHNPNVAKQKELTAPPALLD